MCIDYILVLNNGARVKTLKSSVLDSFKSGNVSHASDHLPVFAKVRILTSSSADVR